MPFFKKEDYSAILSLVNKSIQENVGMAELHNILERVHEGGVSPDELHGLASGIGFANALHQGKEGNIINPILKQVERFLEKDTVKESDAKTQYRSSVFDTNEELEDDYQTIFNLVSKTTQENVGMLELLQILERVHEGGVSPDELHGLASGIGFANTLHQGKEGNIINPILKQVERFLEKSKEAVLETQEVQAPRPGQ